jgi:hypothetical protein
MHCLQRIIDVLPRTFFSEDSSKQHPADVQPGEHNSTAREHLASLIRLRSNVGVCEAVEKAERSRARQVKAEAEDANQAEGERASFPIVD